MYSEIQASTQPPRITDIGLGNLANGPRYESRHRSTFVTRKIQRNPAIPSIPSDIELEISRKVREETAKRPPLLEKSRRFFQRIFVPLRSHGNASSSSEDFTYLTLPKTQLTGVAAIKKIPVRNMPEESQQTVRDRVRRVFSRKDKPVPPPNNAPRPVRYEPPNDNYRRFRPPQDNTIQPRTVQNIHQPEFQQKPGAKQPKPQQQQPMQQQLLQPQELSKQRVPRHPSRPEIGQYQQYWQSKQPAGYKKWIQHQHAAPAQQIPQNYAYSGGYQQQPYQYHQHCQPQQYVYQNQDHHTYQPTHHQPPHFALPRYQQPQIYQRQPAYHQPRNKLSPQFQHTRGSVGQIPTVDPHAAPSTRGRYTQMKSPGNTDLTHTIANASFCASSVDSIRSQFSDHRDAQSKDDSMASSFAWNYRNRPPSRPNPKLGVQTDPSMSSNASTFKQPDIRSTTGGSTISVSHISTKHTSAPQTRDVPHAHVPPTIVVHGGIVPSKHPLTPDLDASVRRSLKKSLETGYSILLNGGTAVHAVEAVVRTLENNKLFSAGRGAPISSTGHPLLDATICDGHKQRAASAACASTIPNPIVLARKILESGKMTTACSKTADILAEEFEMPQIDPAQLITEHRVSEYKAWQANRLGTPRYSPARVPVQAAGRRGNSSALAGGGQGNQDIYPSCGVGAVAIDSRGKVAAASSSGGVIGRREGQISECGCIGASAWADSQVAISGVSTHDLCICQQTAHTIALRARYRQRTLESAAVSALTDLMISTGAEGAFVAIDNMGKFSMVFSADSMVRGFCSVTSNHEPVVAIGAGERISSGDIHLA